VAPLEFSTDNTTHYRAALAAVLAASGFVATFKSALVELGVSELIGLTLLPPETECALRGAQWLLEEGADARGLVTTVYAAGDGPVDALVLDGSHDVVWVASTRLNSYATQRKCNVRNTKCRTKVEENDLCLTE